MLLHEFLVSILPFVLEHRLDLDRSLMQRVSLALQAESALVSFILSPVVGKHAVSCSGGGWLVAGLVLELIGSMMIASAGSRGFSLTIQRTHPIDIPSSIGPFLRASRASSRQHGGGCSWPRQPGTEDIAG